MWWNCPFNLRSTQKVKDEDRNTEINGHGVADRHRKLGPDYNEYVVTH